jgi:hypothetical protein
LTHLDGRALPTAFEDPHGRYVLHAGELTLDADGGMWFVLDLIPVPDTTGGRGWRSTLAEEYRRVGPDSLVFPGDTLASVPEFFGRRRGRELVLVARPAPVPRGISVAREHGGAHTWRFVAR